MRVSVCVPVREYISGTTSSIFTTFSEHVTYGRVSIGPPLAASRYAYATHFWFMDHVISPLPIIVHMEACRRRCSVVRTLTSPLLGVSCALFLTTASAKTSPSCRVAGGGVCDALLPCLTLQRLGSAGWPASWSWWTLCRWVSRWVSWCRGCCAASSVRAAASTWLHSRRSRPRCAGLRCGSRPPRPRPPSPSRLSESTAHHVKWSNRSRSVCCFSRTWR